jgi:hypothetical protein
LRNAARASVNAEYEQFVKVKNYAKPESLNALERRATNALSQLPGEANGAKKLERMQKLREYRALVNNANLKSLARTNKTLNDQYKQTQKIWAKKEDATNLNTAMTALKAAFEAAKAQKAANAAAAATAKAAANAAAEEARKAADQQKKIRNFVVKMWPLTKGNTNSRTKLWTPRIQNNAELTRQLNGLKGTLSAANIEAIKTNINKAASNKKIGYLGVWPAEKKNANLNNRIKQAKWIVNLGLGQQPTPQTPWRQAKKEWNAATRIGARWKGRKVRGAFLNAAQEASKAAMALRAAASVPGGPTKAQQLAKQVRLARIANNLAAKFVTGAGNPMTPANFNGINRNELQGLTKNEIVAHLKGVNGFKPANTRAFNNANLVAMAQYFSP